MEHSIFRLVIYIVKLRLNSVKSKWKSLRSSANKRGIPFSISLKDFENIVNKTTHCYYFDSPLEQDNISVDRKDCTKGYHYDNIVLCCKEANNLKNQLFENEKTKIDTAKVQRLISIVEIRGNKMFTKKEYEHCIIYYNPYEDIEILQGITDCIGVDVYISGQHCYEGLTLGDAKNFLHTVGVDFKTEGND